MLVVIIKKHSISGVCVVILVVTENCRVRLEKVWLYSIGTLNRRNKIAERKIIVMLTLLYSIFQKYIPAFFSKKAWLGTHTVTYDPQNAKVDHIGKSGEFVHIEHTVKTGRVQLPYIT